MSDQDLMPCPFCGEVQPPHDDSSWIRCLGCGTETGWQATGDEAIAAWNRRPAATNDREARLVAALTDHNDLLRSAMQIAKREGVEGEIGTTNWDAYYNRVAVVLKRHHGTANEARALLAEIGETK
jgi:hypothetical protein